MRSSLRWGSFLVAALLLTSCKTQLQPTVSKDRFYEIDASYRSDSAIVSYYTPYKQQLEAEMNRVIGFSDLHLSKSRDAESLAGNFFTDALLWEGQKLDAAVQISFGTKGGIRNDLKSGDITVGNIFEIMPFENAVTILTLSGTDILRWADYLADTGGQPCSGVTLVIQNRKVKEFLVQGKAVDPNATYKLVTYDYLANGGDYVTCFDKPINRVDYPQRVRESLMDYVADHTKQGKHIQAKLDGRVRIIE